MKKTEKQIEIYDTTLRDGCQAEGIALTLEDKLEIAARLDELGVRYIEGGYPLSNPKDAEFFCRAPELGLKKAATLAFFKPSSGALQKNSASLGLDSG